MSRRRKAPEVKRSEYTAVRMEPELYEQAFQRAQDRYQTFSEYVRQLIVRDLEERKEALANA
jgi:Arc/MetJ-type ribon-helix-helix transcriptional regulator